MLTHLSLPKQALQIPSRICSLNLISTAPRIVRTLPFLEIVRNRINLLIPKSLDSQIAKVKADCYSSTWLAAPDDSGWFVIKLDNVQSGNATGNDAAIKAARGNIARSVGREYVEQFAKAVRADVGVKTNPSALARVRADLLGQGGGGN